MTEISDGVGLISSRGVCRIDGMGEREVGSKGCTRPESMQIYPTLSSEDDRMVRYRALRSFNAKKVSRPPNDGTPRTLLADCLNAGRLETCRFVFGPSASTSDHTYQYVLGRGYVRLRVDGQLMAPPRSSLLGILSGLKSALFQNVWEHSYKRSNGRTHR